MPILADESLNDTVQEQLKDIEKFYTDSSDSPIVLKSYINSRGTRTVGYESETGDIIPTNIPVEGFLREKREIEELKTHAKAFHEQAKYLFSAAFNLSDYVRGLETTLDEKESKRLHNFLVNAKKVLEFPKIENYLQKAVMPIYTQTKSNGTDIPLDNEIDPNSVHLFVHNTTLMYKIKKNDGTYFEKEISQVELGASYEDIKHAVSTSEALSAEQNSAVYGVMPKDGYKTMQSNGAIPIDNAIQANTIHLYVETNVLKYATKNHDGTISRINITQAELGASYTAIKNAVSARTALTEEQKLAVFDVTSKKGYAYEGFFKKTEYEAKLAAYKESLTAGSKKVQKDLNTIMAERGTWSKIGNDLLALGKRAFKLIGYGLLAAASLLPVIGYVAGIAYQEFSHVKKDSHSLTEFLERQKTDSKTVLRKDINTNDKKLNEKLIKLKSFADKSIEDSNSLVLVDAKVRYKNEAGMLVEVAENSTKDSRSVITQSLFELEHNNNVLMKRKVGQLYDKIYQDYHQEVKGSKKWNPTITKELTNLADITDKVMNGAPKIADHMKNGLLKTAGYLEALKEYEKALVNFEMLSEKKMNYVSWKSIGDDIGQGCLDIVKIGALSVGTMIPIVTTFCGYKIGAGANSKPDNKSTVVNNTNQMFKKHLNEVRNTIAELSGEEPRSERTPGCW